MCSLAVSCTYAPDFDSRLRAITKPHLFSIVKWEFGALLEEAGKAVSSGPIKVDDEASTVAGYFSAVGEIKKLKSEIGAINAGGKLGDVAALETELNELQGQNTNLAETVERILEKQVREALSQQGVFNPLYKYLRFKIPFPPLNFRLEGPPRLLVVSPRDKIESMREITLQQNINLEQIESIEDRMDKLGISPLVVALGGFAGTYPSFVTHEADLRFVLDAVAEEWLHQYLAFKPLGFRYLLDLTGIARDYEIATMNETVASMAGKEIGTAVYDKYYAQNAETEAQAKTEKSGFDFDREMSDIRRAVDVYLAKGEIEQAEKFMEEKRQYLAANGYHIRKLNQAYFAFHGTYADRPASISPIGAELRELRRKSASLQEFLETTASMSSRQDLKDSIK
ncbi:hypothetical protein ACFLTV_02095 [Chloroflexota bacterium]